MVKKWYRWMSLVIVIMMIFVFALAGCQKKEEPTGEETVPTVATEDSSEKEIDEKFSYTFVVYRDRPIADDNLVFALFEEKFNVEINFNFIDPDTWDEQLGIIFASRNIPDLIWQRISNVGGNSPETLAKYAYEGIIASVPIELIRKNMPNYSEYIDSFGEEIWKYGIYDGENYGMPIPDWRGRYHKAIVWRADWLKNVGLDKIPETLDEFEDAFTRFVNNDPNGTNRKDTYALTASGKKGPSEMFNEFFGAHGTIPYSWLERDGELVYGFTQEGTKDTLKLLNRWYVDKLIDPEFVTEDERTDGMDISYKFVTEKIGYLSHLEGDDSQWDDDGHLNEKWLKQYPSAMRHVYEEGHENDVMYFKFTEPFTDLKTAPDDVYVIGKPPVGPNGDSGMPYDGIGAAYVFFGKQLEDNRPKMEKLLSIWDTVISDPQHLIETTFGEEGLLWDWVDHPVVGRYAEWSQWFFENRDEVNKQPDKYRGYNILNPIWAEHMIMHRYFRGHRFVQRVDTFEAVCKYEGYENKVKIGLPSLPNYPDLNKVLDEFFLKAIIGEVDIDSEYDKVVNLWKNNGGDVLTKEANDWYDTIR